MARLRLPEVGTVVRVEGNLEAALRAEGWVDADAPARASAPPAKRTRSGK